MNKNRGNNNAVTIEGIYAFPVVNAARIYEKRKIAFKKPLILN